MQFDFSLILNGAVTEANLVMHGPIGDGGWFDEESVTATRVRKELEALPKTVNRINVGINSFGGSLCDGLAIYNALKAHPAKVVVTVDGVAMSAASLIAMAGDEIRMPATSIMMIHAPSSRVSGNAVEMRKAADVLDKFSDAMVSAYTDKTGKTAEEIKALVSDGEDHFFTGKEAVEAGFADTLVGEVAPVPVKASDGRWTALISASFQAGLKPAPKPEPAPEVKPVLVETPTAAAPAAASTEDVTALKGRLAELEAAFQTARDAEAAAKAQLLKEVEAREVAASIEAAKDAFKHLPISAETVGPMLRKVRALDPAIADGIEAVLKSVDAISAQCLTASGKSGVGASSAEERLEKLVKAKMTEQPKMSREKAESEVFNENPSLYTALRAEQD